MLEPVIVLRGTEADIEEVIREARAEFDHATLDVSESAPIQAQPLERRPYRHLDWVEVTVKLVISLAPTVVREIRDYIKRQAEKRNVTVIDPPSPPPSSTTDDTTKG